MWADVPREGEKEEPVNCRKHVALVVISGRYRQGKVKRFKEVRFIVFKSQVHI